MRGMEYALQMRPGFNRPYRNAPDVVGARKWKNIGRYNDRDLHLISNTNIFNDPKTNFDLNPLDRYATEQMRQYSNCRSGKKLLPPPGVMRSISQMKGSGNAKQSYQMRSQE